MKVNRFVQLFAYATIAVVFTTGFLSSGARAQETQTARIGTHSHAPSPDALVKIVRESTERFRDVHRPKRRDTR